MPPHTNKMPKLTARDLNAQPYYPAPNMVREWGDVDERGYLDTPRFAQFCIQMLKAINCPMSYGDIRRAMGDGYNQRWAADAIENLVGSGRLKRLWGAYSRFERTGGDPKQVEVGKFTIPKPTTVKKPDSGAIYGTASLF